MHILYMRLYVWSQAADIMGLTYGTNNSRDWNPIKDLLNTESKLCYLCLRAQPERIIPQIHEVRWAESKFAVSFYFTFMFCFVLFFSKHHSWFKGIMRFCYLYLIWVVEWQRTDLFPKYYNLTPCWHWMTWRTWVWDYKCSQLTVWLCRPEIWETF